MHGYLGDVLVSQTPDGGAMNFIAGQPDMTGGLATMVYFYLFGGNADDDGSVDSQETWWGNYIEEDPAGQVHARTQNLLRGLPLTPGNLNLLNTTVKADLAPAIQLGIISDLVVSSEFVARNHIKVILEMTSNGKPITLTYQLNWQAMQEALE